MQRHLGETCLVFLQRTKVNVTGEGWARGRVVGTEVREVMGKAKNISYRAH